MTEILFRDMDAETIEREYNPRLSVPDWADIFARWERKSADFTKHADTRLDIAYADTRPEECLDIFYPAAAGGPVLFFIHGGYWRAMDKSLYNFCLETLVAAGALAVSINYTLCPAVRLTEIVAQTRRAVAWTWRNAEAHGGDRSRFVITGHSAGGHLTAMMAATDWSDLDDDPPEFAYVPISGLFDLKPLRHVSVNKEVRMDTAEAEANSPMRLSPPRPAAMSVLVGGAETAEFNRQSEEFAAAWQDRMVTTEVQATPGDHHFSIIENMTIPESPVTATLRRHLGLG